MLDRREPRASAMNDTQIIYDGACPFCTRYARLSRLREAVGPVTLIDARQGGPAVEAVKAAGFNLDEGMVLKYAGRVYHGADCLNMIALLSSRSGLTNRAMSVLFSHPTLARVSYPALRAMRNLALRLLGHRQINDL